MAMESLVWVTEQVDFRTHLGPDMAKKIFTEVRQDIPGAIIDQAQHFSALICVLADSYIEIGYMRVKGGSNIAVLYVEVCIVQTCLGRFSPCINIPKLTQFILGSGDLAVRVCDGCFGSLHSGTCVEDVVVGYEVVLQERPNAIQIVLISLELRLTGCCRSNRISERTDLKVRSASALSTADL
jgi:hypothetical protein